MPTISASTALCSSSRLRPLSVLPTCQSEVCSIFTGEACLSDHGAGHGFREIAQNGGGSSSGLGSLLNGSAGGFRPGAAGGPALSDGRVAQAGNGNSTASDTGICGWLTNMVP